MTYAEFFYEFKGKFMGADVSDIKEHLAFQFNIEDEEAGGAFYVEVKDGELHVEPYEYYDRDAIFICAPDVLMKIAEGEMDPVAAFTAQKLRVEGNIEKALRLKEIIELKRGSQEKDKSVVKKAADKVVDAVVKTAAKKAAGREKKSEAGQDRQQKRG
ncbi:MAG: SCP2 sterol-binding domain-containing protein [Lachnospiraceae bacterium]|nr:SCP2 sterol-binding domain-containing protein [Lachnospiraceae bacterium]